MARPTVFTILDFYNLEAPYVTEFSRLLHRILNKPRVEGTEIKSIMLTSAMLSEGKSTVCAFMGITAALKKGMKTLILDTDLRRPSINKVFQLPEHAGLVEVLVDGYNAREAVQKTAVDKLDILATGRRCDNPTEIFDAEAIGGLIEEMKFYYDLVLVDSAPLLPVSDPMLLASKVDGIVIVIKAGATQKEVVKRAVGILEPVRNHVLGVALNNMTHSLPYYYDYSYYHYDYSTGSSKLKKRSNGEKKNSNRRDLKKIGEGRILPNKLTPNK